MRPIALDTNTVESPRMSTDTADADAHVLQVEGLRVIRSWQEALP
ncbi:hypothetical protein NZK32_05875 [Cyanobium sp. FGCU-52]|nr:hypothetical protein [Cyanobium sp. FGCU52]